jgi:hypothetical protein
MTVRPTRTAPALLLSLSFAAVLASAANAGPCDKPILRAEGRMSGWAYAPAYKEMVARRLCVRKWEQTATELHGASYARWANAKGRNIDCEFYRDHPWLKGRVSCVAAAIPCSAAPK